VNRSGQRASISPHASRQPWVTCPSISRGTASRLAFGWRPAWRAAWPFLLSVEDGQLQRLGHGIVVQELGARFQDFPHFLVEALDGICRVKYSPQGRPYSRNGMNRSHSRSHTASAAGYFLPSGVPEKIRQRGIGRVRVAGRVNGPQP
jgi:hypothetical protein